MRSRTTQEFLELAQLSYMDAHHLGFPRAEQLATPEGFRALSTSYGVLEHDDNGYGGVAFINESTKELIIATAGTGAGKVFKDFDNLEDDLRSDIDLMQGKVPRQFEKAAKPYVDKLIEELGGADFLADYTVTFTGHSLGAVLSEVMATHYHQQLSASNVRAVTFDSPGSKDIIENEYGEEVAAVMHDKIIIHNATPNVINTINDQVGQVYKLVYQNLIDAWRNIVHTDPMRKIYKIAAEVISFGKIEGEDISFSVAISTHSLSKFEGEINEATGEFFKEVMVPNWNDIHKRAEAMKFIDGLEFVKFWLSEDIKGVRETKISKVIEDFERTFDNVVDDVADWFEEPCFWNCDDE